MRIEQRVYCCCHVHYRLLRRISERIAFTSVCTLAAIEFSVLAALR